MSEQTPKPSEPTQDGKTPADSYVAVIEECCRFHQHVMGEYRKALIDKAIAEAKREQMEADCDLLSEMACMERRRESQALRAAVAIIRAEWEKKHK